MRQAGRLQKVYDAHKGKADFYWIYLKEAHASDSRRPNRKIKIKQHITLDDRIDAANKCVADIDLSIPLLVDDMKNTVGDAFSGHPDRLFVLSPNGTVAYSGGRGPRGFDVAEMEKALKKLLSEEDTKAE